MNNTYIPSWKRDTVKEKTEKELLEMATAKESDLDADEIYLAPRTKTVVDIYWKIQGHLGEFDIRKHKSTGSWIVGKFNGDSFISVLYIEFKSVDTSFLSRNGYKKVKQVAGVVVADDLRGAGIAKETYKYLVKHLGLVILGDSEQYFGARRLWARLSKELDVTVDIIDIKNNIVIEKDVILHHGNYDHDFDKRVWSYTTEMKDIRLILTDIK